MLPHRTDGGFRAVCVQHAAHLQNRNRVMAPTAAEFFAGMGLVRAALTRVGVETVFANDVNRTKAALYRDNWRADGLRVDDVRALTGGDVPTVDLATASFPCVDVSLAGARAGLDGTQSGLVFEFFRILDEMGQRAPATVMFENVPGLLTSNGGRDWRASVGGLEDLGYATAHVCIDAAAFVPQSRARVFLIGSRRFTPRIPAPPDPREDMRLADIADGAGDWGGRLGWVCF